MLFFKCSIKGKVVTNNQSEIWIQQIVKGVLQSFHTFNGHLLQAKECSRSCWYSSRHRRQNPPFHAACVLVCWESGGQTINTCQMVAALWGRRKRGKELGGKDSAVRRRVIRDTFWGDIWAETLVGQGSGAKHLRKCQCQQGQNQ